MAKLEFTSIKIGGLAGQGVKSVGLMFAKLATRSGYHIYDYTEYPSLIRGGHNVMQILISKDMVTAPSSRTDLLVALNQETITRHKSEIPSGGGIIFDAEKKFDFSLVNKDINLFLVPLSKLANEAGGKELLINTVAMGVVAALLGGDLEILKNLISEEFSDKKPEIVQMNHRAVEAGYNFALENFKDKVQTKLAPLPDVVPNMILNGNDAAALGAVAGGLQFASVYPMTPITGTLHLLASFQKKYGFIYKQPEDEISAINMAIGAAFAGVRAFTATSGGGFCLMTEAYGLAGITETPLVILMGMRTGPATGMPTWSGQGDLRFMLSAAQDDFPRIVLAAGDGKEVFDLTMKAFNLAEKYQAPVIVLVDKNICENDQSFEYFDESSYVVNRGKLTLDKKDNFKRYELSPDGISTRSIPGTGNFFMANSYEHDEYGFDTEESDMRIKQHEKRMSKLITCEKEDMPEPLLCGPEKADLTIVSWGSNKGSILQAIKEFQNVNYLHLAWMNPFPAEAVKRILSSSKSILGMECSYTAQLMGLITEKTGIEIKNKFLKYDGRPFFVEEVSKKISEILNNNL